MKNPKNEIRKVRILASKNTDRMTEMTTQEIGEVMAEKRRHDEAKKLHVQRCQALVQAARDKKAHPDDPAYESPATLIAEALLAGINKLGYDVDKIGTGTFRFKFLGE